MHSWFQGHSSGHPVFIMLALMLAAAIAVAQAPQKNGRLTPLDMTYATVGGKPLKLSLFLPQDTSKPVPLVINIHGGGWREGTRRNVSSARMVELGFAVASVDYRLTSQAGQWGKEPVIFPAQIQDVKGAVRWLRAHAAEYHLDPDRFAAWGGSAGGHLATLLATAGEVKELEGEVGGNLTVSSQVQAAVDLFGPTDMLHMDDDTTTDSARTLPYQIMGDQLLAGLIGFPAQPGRRIDLATHLNDPAPPYPAYRKLLVQASPITFVTPASPPVFIGHGSRDPLVPVGQSQRLYAALKKAGVRTELMITPGGGHGGISGQTYLAAMRFLCETLNNPEGARKVATLKLTGGRPRAGLMQRLMRALR